MYLSKTPLSCTDLTQKLGLSKALISPALDELCNYKLIEEAPAPNEKTKVYRAVENINDVIKHVLEIRERKMLKQITRDFDNFKQKDASSSEYDQTKIESLEDMILSANLMLEIMLSQKNLMQLPMELEPNRDAPA